MTKQMKWAATKEQLRRAGQQHDGQTNSDIPKRTVWLVSIAALSSIIVVLLSKQYQKNNSINCSGRKSK